MTDLNIPDHCVLRGTDESGAVFSALEHYRYVLWRVWGTGPVMVWVMINPSTACALKDDATIRKCCGFARKMLYSGIVVVNLFGFRSRDPQDLLGSWNGSHNDREWAPRPFAQIHGPDNDACIEAVAKHTGAKRLWCGWGASLPELVEPRVRELSPFLSQFSLLCFGTSKGGAPRHPLMLPYRTPAVAWSLPAIV